MAETASCGHVRTTRVVGFKILDSSVSPTSVVPTDIASHSTIDDSPRSLIAVALKADNFKPLPRLTIKTKPKHSNLAALKRCKSHADLGLKSHEGSEPATPASKSSTSSTPMTIPSTMHRVHTCPIELTEISQTYLSTRHNRRSSTSSSDTIVRDLFDANTVASTTIKSEVGAEQLKISRMSLYGSAASDLNHKSNNTEHDGSDD